IRITEAAVHEINILDELIPEAGAIYIMDRGYLDFQRLYALHQCASYFVVRAKANTRLRRLRKRGKDPNLDRDICLRPGGHHKEPAENTLEPLHNSTDF
ncbi:MAG: transposase, partial [Deltaproteobacteria bacterium]|nr:transposase [Deltaproteobacteria bacterium]